MNEEVISNLVELGYSREEVVKALEVCDNNPEDAYEYLNKEEERYKLVFLVRTDLNMGVGKIAAQVGHATIGAYKQCSSDVLDKWEESGQAKIVLQVDSLDQLLLLDQFAQSLGLKTYPVQDAGRTQVEPGTTTVCSIGPDAESKINQVTGSLKLYR
jgi:peptidyl-tRNA hydrolase, PTH2 family